MALVELHNISYSYKIDGQSIPVLSNINLDIEEGELIAIQGPSGSGKSTLLYLIGCLMRFQKGSVHIDEQDISKLSNEDLAVFRNRKIGFIFQQFHLLPKANVLQNILLPTLYPCEFALNNPAKLDIANQLAKRFDLDDRLGHFPNQLSGGQQQRVAIARSLINNPSIILADEPTGNLDSKSSANIMKLLKELNEKGKTIVVITHDTEIASQCSKIYHIRDGEITSSENSSGKSLSGKSKTSNLHKRNTFSSGLGAVARSLSGYLKMSKTLLPLALENLYRNKARTLLTMLGITIGIAAVLAMVTLGQFTKRKILDSYAELGVNTLMFYGYPNWDMKATDIVPVMYRFFDWDRDLVPLKNIFPQIISMSPLLHAWDNKVDFGGKAIDSDIQVFGVNSDAIHITKRELIAGKNFSPYHIDKKSSVCIIGFEIAQRLFSNTTPLGQVLHVSQGENSYGCRIIGVLKSTTSNKEWLKPNLHILLPYTYFQATAEHWWSSQIKEVAIQVDPTSDIEKTGKSIRSFFETKYGKSGRFRVDSDSVLIAQMKKFLNLFTIMLATIALISLSVGGIGITNMMLVSVSERFREIGLRKALGATDTSIRVQFLVESIVICTLAGVLGILFGFIAYEFVIFGASKLVTKLHFEWVVDYGALCLSLVSIALVGVLSGFFPALKAERLQVIEALRSE